MTKFRKGAVIRRVKDISIGGALVVTLLSGMILPSCSSSNNDDEAYSYEETTYGKGIRSHIKEVKPGEFRITDEEEVPADSSAAIVTYLDGHTDKLSPTAAKALIDKEIQHNNAYVGHHSGLSSMLLYGGMGYLLGRNSGFGYINNYRDRDNGATARGFYSSPEAYNRGRQAESSVSASRSTRTVVSRPSSGRSGFFGRSSGRSGG